MSRWSYTQLHRHWGLARRWVRNPDVVVDDTLEHTVHRRMSQAFQFDIVQLSAINAEMLMRSFMQDRNQVIRFTMGNNCMLNFHP